jgi:site-specific recombinase XerD
MRLSEAIDALAIATKVNGRSERTVQNYREKCTRLVHFLGDVDVSGITLNDLRGFVASLMDSRLSPHSVQSYIRHVKRLFSWLTEEGHLERNPAERIKATKPRTQEIKAISPDDFLAILATTEGGSAIDRRDRAMILLLADSGARAGGVCGLRLQDVDLDRGTADVIEKGGRRRVILFTPETAQAIKGWLDVRPDRGHWLFTGLRHYDKEAMSPNSLRQMLDRRAERAGVTGPHGPHSFRHAFAIAYLMTGGDLPSLSRILGHSSIAVTADFYARFSQEQLRQKHAKHSPVARLFGGGENGKTD